MDMFEIMDRESSSRSEVYLYEENGKWYAFGKPAQKVGCRDYQTEEPCMLLLWCYAGEGGGRP